MRPDSEPDGQRTFIEEARRAQIVAAATEVVAEVGYARSTLARIAERAGVSKGVISYHFDGKDDLLATVAGDFFHHAWEHMEPTIAAARSCSEAVAAWLTTELEYFAAHRSAFLAMSEVIMNHRAPDGSRPFASDEDEELDGMAELLRAGQEAGEFRTFDPRQVAALVLRCTEGVTSAWVMDERIDLGAQAEVLVDFVLRGLTAGDTA